ncbi:shikimate kinase [Candidatus Gottesmanbacteria bacterium]|nr:shikimate kinase [Candidatus Gottesmanbacteria bacterium]
MNIVLIGMRGTGKTTIAKMLSTKLNRPYVETDQIIEERAGGKSIAVIVEENTWQGFRAMEKKVVEEVSKSSQNAVISAGGGVVLNRENMENLKKNNDGIIIWLKANIDTIVAHIGTNYTRPRLTTAPTWVEELKIVYEKRKGLYEKFADLTINTDDKNPEQIAEEIISKLKTKNYQL